MMFDNKRYITTGCQQQIPLELQLFMWDCIDKLKVTNLELDYLQVFELTLDRIDNIFFQKVEHRQEVPEYKEVYKTSLKEIIDATVFVIDNGDHSTMLLNSEY